MDHDAMYAREFRESNAGKNSSSKPYTRDITENGLGGVTKSDGCITGTGYHVAFTPRLY